jgi:hypothetical protein
MKETPDGLITTKQMWAILAFIVVAFGITNIGGESCEIGYLYGNGIYITHLDSNPEVKNLLAPYLKTNQTTAWDKNDSNDFKGRFVDLIGKPTDLKNFTNKAGYITLANISQLPATLETDPQVGAVTAGMYCGGNGTAINCNLTAPTTQSSSTPTVNYNYSGYVTYFNEFSGDAVDAYPITLGTQTISSATNIFGVYKWTSGTTIGNDAGIGLGYTTTTTGALYNITYSTLETRMLWGNTAGQRFFIGFLKTSGSADMTTINAAATFMTNTSIGGYWQAMCCNAAGAANCYKVNTTIARDAVNYHRFKIATTDAYAAFYIDDILRGNCSIANKYPRNVGYAYVGTYQETTDVAADNHQLDYIYLRTKRR